MGETTRILRHRPGDFTGDTGMGIDYILLEVVGVGMKIIRVFPHRNSYTPDDDLAFFDEPGLFIPDHDEVHVCCVFTWDIERCKELQFQWQGVTNKPVKLGGPAFGDAAGEFVPGMYVRQGITFTSRGCNNSCPWCFVPKREGKLRELPIVAGNVIQDNNFLQCSKTHRENVYSMLQDQRKISFRGGLETRLLTDWDIEQMAKLRINELWLACDTKGAIDSIQVACEKLHAAGFSQNKIRCYVLIGDDRQENENRLKSVYNAGALPFAQLFQPVERIEYSREWKQFARVWSRPAVYKSVMREAIK